MGSTKHNEKRKIFAPEIPCRKPLSNLSLKHCSCFGKYFFFCHSKGETCLAADEYFVHPFQSIVSAYAVELQKLLPA